MKINMQTEPAVIISAIMGVINAGVALLPLFGVPLTPEQQAGIGAFTAAVAAAVGAFWIRSKVFAPDTVKHLTEGQQIQ